MIVPQRTPRTSRRGSLRPLDDRASASRGGESTRRCGTTGRPTAGTLLFALVTALQLLGVGGVRAEVEEASANGFLIENEEIVPVAPSVAWDSLIEEIDLWWPKDHTWWVESSTLSIEPEPGGCFCEIAGKRRSQHLMVTHVEPPTLLRLTGGLGPLQSMGLHGALEWRLEPIEEGTLITLRYQVGGYTPDDLSELAPVVDRVQALQLGGLARHLREATVEEAGEDDGG